MSRWIKKGISVVNITNLEKIMTVEKVVYQSKKIKDENGLLKLVSRIVCIDCKIVNSDGESIVVPHHSKELVPLSIVVKGNAEVYKFINREDPYKNY